MLNIGLQLDQRIPPAPVLREALVIVISTYCSGSFDPADTSVPPGTQLKNPLASILFHGELPEGLFEHVANRSPLSMDINGRSLLGAAALQHAVEAFEAKGQETEEQASLRKRKLLRVLDVLNHCGAPSSTSPTWVTCSGRATIPRRFTRHHWILARIHSSNSLPSQRGRDRTGCEFDRR